VDGVAVNGLSEAERTAVRQKKISFVFQAFRLFHSLSAIENVALGFELRDPALPGRMELARDLLVRFGLGEKLNQEPYELSPGEKQRVAIARALAGNPPILLADEPTASLDAQAGRSICQLLRSQVDDDGRTVVVVTHDPRWQEFGRSHNQPMRWPNRTRGEKLMTARSRWVIGVSAIVLVIVVVAFLGTMRSRNSGAKRAG